MRTLVNVTIMSNKPIPQDIADKVLDRLAKTSERYLAECPKCKDFFYKKRKDQVYCSERCRAADSSLRYLKSKRRTNE